MRMAKAVVATGLAVAGVYGILKAFFTSEKKNQLERLVPHATFNEFGVLKELESFGDYVVRQLGLDAESAIAKTVSKAAEGYLRDDKEISNESREIACVLVTGPTVEEVEKVFCEDILQELELFVVTYFSFHWEHASAIIDKVISAGATRKRLHRAVLTTLRNQRYDDVLKSLSTKRRFNTLLEEMKRIGSTDASVPDEGIVTIPAEPSKRNPVILFIGGGMGAGKSTVVKEILSSSFWSGVIHKAVVVEADAFKETDVIYRTLSEMALNDVAKTSELVHQYSTDAASSLLVSALNEGRDVVFDGTMSWEPFVLQTIAMVRDVHKRRYRMGPGYKQMEDGTEIERYWEPADSDDDDEDTTPDVNRVDKRSYRIEFVGVTCDAHLAVVRGMRRAVSTKRGVPVKGQLRSHKMFASSIAKYMSLVDSSKIYSTSRWKGPAEMIALKKGPDQKLLIDVESYPTVTRLADLNTDSQSVVELYSKENADRHVNQFWNDVILDKGRENRQKELRAAILANASTSVLLERSLSQQLSMSSDNGTPKAQVTPPISQDVSEGDEVSRE